MTSAERAGTATGSRTPTAWAEALYAARRDRAPIPPISDADTSLGPAGAYAIQQELVAMILREGGSVVGYKLGLTSRPMQQLLGVDQPDYGPVLSSMVFDDGATIASTTLIQPKAEAEIALTLERPLRGPGVTVADAAAAIAGARAAIEVVDSRISDWKIKLVDTVADLASSAAIVLGRHVVPIEGWDPRLVGMVVAKNGEVQGTGAGAAALGDPVSAVAWLANTLAPFDVTLEPGHFVMTGALHAAFPVAPGDIVHAEFDRLGSVTARFEEEVA
ncbi:MAG: 2-keto-4-pentenoate hydratase [Actinomycetota bacterium]